MLLFQEPSPTRFDLRFNIAGIPVRVHPTFWLITLLFGSVAGDLASLLMWIPAVFVSILVHELGQAFVMRLCGRPAHTMLYLGGGLTEPKTVSWGYHQADTGLTIYQGIAIALAGPVTSFLLAGLELAGVRAAGGIVEVTFLFGLLPYPMALLPAGGWLIGLVIKSLLWVNIVWGLINLLPVYPLDGGQLARYAWLKRDPSGGVRMSLWFSAIAGAVAAFVSLVLLQSLYIALFFAVLAIAAIVAKRKMEREELELQAARYACGHLKTSEMQKFVNGLLNSGVFVDEFLNVVNPETAAPEIVGAAFEKALMIMGIAKPGYEEAMGYLLRYRISQIANGEIDAFEGLKALISEIHPDDGVHGKTEKIPGDPYGIENLVGLYRNANDPIERPAQGSPNAPYDEHAIPELKNQIVTGARKWLERYGAVSTASTAR